MKNSTAIIADFGGKCRSGFFAKSRSNPTTDRPSQKLKGGWAGLFSAARFGNGKGVGETS
jgi:hypothetical protein